jgi:hypothetical protein
LRVFGCTNFVKIKRNDKLDVNSIKTIFLGTHQNLKAPNVMTPLQKKNISRNVTFIENELYFQDKNKLETQNNPCTIDQADLILPQLYDLDTL